MCNKTGDKNYFQFTCQYKMYNFAAVGAQHGLHVLSLLGDVQVNKKAIPVYLRLIVTVVFVKFKSFQRSRSDKEKITGRCFYNF